MTSLPQKSFRARPVEEFFNVYSVNGPVANALISLQAYYDEAIGEFVPITSNLCNITLPTTATTDANGKASLCVLQGTWIIQASADGYYTAQQTVTFVDSTMTNIQLTKIPPVPLPPPITYYGLVAYINQNNYFYIYVFDPITMNTVTHIPLGAQVGYSSYIDHYNFHPWFIYNSAYNKYYIYASFYQTFSNSNTISGIEYLGLDLKSLQLTDYVGFTWDYMNIVTNAIYNPFNTNIYLSFLWNTYYNTSVTDGNFSGLYVVEPNVGGIDLGNSTSTPLGIYDVNGLAIAQKNGLSYRAGNIYVGGFNQSQYSDMYPMIGVVSPSNLNKLVGGDFGRYVNFDYTVFTSGYTLIATDSNYIYISYPVNGPMTMTKVDPVYMQAISHYYGANNLGAESLYSDGNYVYLGYGNNGLNITQGIDIIDVNTLKLIKNIKMPTPILSIDKYGNYLYVIAPTNPIQPPIGTEWSVYKINTTTLNIEAKTPPLDVNIAEHVYIVKV
jgi:hypothetical protein